MRDDMETAVLSVGECAKYLKVSRGSAYQGVMTGEIPHVEIGCGILIPRRSIEKLLEGKGDKATS